MAVKLIKKLKQPISRNQWKNGNSAKFFHHDNFYYENIFILAKNTNKTSLFFIKTCLNCEITERYENNLSYSFNFVYANHNYQNKKIARERFLIQI